MPVTIIKHKIYMQCHWSFYIVTLNTIQFIRFLKEYKQIRIGTTPLWPRMPSAQRPSSACISDSGCNLLAALPSLTLAEWHSVIIPLRFCMQTSYQIGWCGVALHRFMVGFSSRKSVLDMPATAGRQYITLPVRTQWACSNELLQTNRTDGLCLGMCHGII